MSRLLSVLISAVLVLGPASMARSMFQDENKSSETRPEATQEPKTEEKSAVGTPAETTPVATPAPAVASVPTVPPEVEAKLEAARRAVAEAIVAAQDAGLVDTTVNPPPVLDILINGYANDRALLKGVTTEKPEAELSVEVFGAWFTGYGLLEGIVPEKNVKIVPPSRGLKAFYDKRAALLNRHIEEVRRGMAAASPAATLAPEEAKPGEEPAKTEEAKASDEDKGDPPL